MPDPIQRDATVTEINRMVEIALNATRNTVGFSEAKTSEFEAGAKVALSKMTPLVISLVETLMNRLTNFECLAKGAEEDLKTISAIIFKYAPPREE